MSGLQRSDERGYLRVRVIMFESATYWDLCSSLMASAASASLMSLLATLLRSIAMATMQRSTRLSW